MAALSHSGDVPTVRGQLSDGASSQRRYPHGLRDILLVATLAHHGGIPTVRSQLLH